MEPVVIGNEATFLRERDVAALATLARSRAEAGEIEHPPARGFTDSALARPVWTRIYEAGRECDG